MSSFLSGYSLILDSDESDMWNYFYYSKIYKIYNFNYKNLLKLI